MKQQRTVKTDLLLISSVSFSSHVHFLGCPAVLFSSTVTDVRSGSWSFCRRKFPTFGVTWVKIFILHSWKHKVAQRLPKSVHLPLLFAFLLVICSPSLWIRLNLLLTPFKKKNWGNFSFIDQMYFYHFCISDETVCTAVIYKVELIFFTFYL